MPHQEDIDGKAVRQAEKAARNVATRCQRLQQMDGRISLKMDVGLPVSPKPHDRIIDDLEGYPREEAVGGVAACFCPTVRKIEVRRLKVQCMGSAIQYYSDK